MLPLPPWTDAGKRVRALAGGRLHCFARGGQPTDERPSAPSEWTRFDPPFLEVARGCAETASNAKTPANGRLSNHGNPGEHS